MFRNRVVCDSHNLSSAVEVTPIYNFPVSVNFVMVATCAIATPGYMFLGILFYPKKQHFRSKEAFKMTNLFTKVVQITQISWF